MKPTRFNIALAFLAVYVIWGSTYLGIKIAIETLPPFLMASLRFIISGILLYALARKSGAQKPSLEHWRSTAIVGTLLLMGGNGGVAWAEQYVPSGIASILIATVPIWMVLFNWIIRGKKPHGLIFLGLVIGFSGIWFLVRPSGATHFHWVGVCVLLIAAFSWAAGSVYSKALHSPDSPFLTVGMQMLCGGLVLGVAAILSGEVSHFEWAAVSTASWWALLYLILIGSFIGFTAYIWLLKVSTVARVSTYAYVNPIVAVFLGSVFAKEVLTASTFIAGGVILAGVIVIQSASEV